jgi:hypothetical protein
MSLDDKLDLIALRKWGSFTLDGFILYNTVLYICMYYDGQKKRFGDFDGFRVLGPLGAIKYCLECWICLYGCASQQHLNGSSEFIYNWYLRVY